MVYKELKAIYIVEEYIPECKDLSELFKSEFIFSEANRSFVVE